MRGLLDFEMVLLSRATTAVFPLWVYNYDLNVKRQTRFHAVLLNCDEFKSLLSFVNTKLWNISLKFLNIDDEKLITFDLWLIHIFSLIGNSTFVGN